MPALSELPIDLIERVPGDRSERRGWDIVEFLIEPGVELQSEAGLKALSLPSGEAPGGWRRWEDQTSVHVGGAAWDTAMRAPKYGAITVPLTVPSIGERGGRVPRG